MTARDKFNGIRAEFWDCKDAEHLTHLDPISAIEDLVESHLEPGRSTEEILREMGAITCEAYDRGKISDAQIDTATDDAIEAARAAFEGDEDLADPSGDDRPLFSVETLAKHRAAIEAAVRALAADATVWQCEPVATVELSPDETLELLRVERPEWFETADAEARG